MNPLPKLQQSFTNNRGTIGTTALVAATTSLALALFVLQMTSQANQSGVSYLVGTVPTKYTPILFTAAAILGSAGSYLCIQTVRKKQTDKKKVMVALAIGTIATLAAIGLSFGITRHFISKRINHAATVFNKCSTNFPSYHKIYQCYYLEYAQKLLRFTSIARIVEGVSLSLATLGTLTIGALACKKYNTPKPTP